MSKWEDPATGRSHLICNRTGASYLTPPSRPAGCGDDQGESSHSIRLEHAFVDRSHLRLHEKRWGRQRDTVRDHDGGMDTNVCPEWIGRVMGVRCRTWSFHTIICRHGTRVAIRLTEIRLSTGLGKSYIHPLDRGGNPDNCNCHFGLRPYYRHLPTLAFPLDFVAYSPPKTRGYRVPPLFSAIIRPGFHNLALARCTCAASRNQRSHSLIVCPARIFPRGPRSNTCAWTGRPQIHRVSRFFFHQY